MIDVTIRCYVEDVDDDVPEDLRKDDDRGSEWRDGVIMVGEIVSFYPSSESGCTLIEMLNNRFTVKESVSEIKKLIQDVRNSQKNFSMIGARN